MNNKENHNLENTEMSDDKVTLENSRSSDDKNTHDDRHHTHHDGSHHSHHEHRSSHSSGRHHRRKHSSKKKKFKINSKLGWAGVIVICILITIFIVVVANMDDRHTSFSDQSNGEQTSENLLVEVINSEGILVKNAVNQYLLIDLLNPANANVIPHSFSNGEGRIDEQIPVSLKLSVKEGNAVLYKIELATNVEFANATVSYLEAAYGTYDFEHLYTNTTYYYRVTAYTRKGAEIVTGSFKTADTPRILSIDGLSNVRDIGNWRTDSGKRIKQGLLIRGVEMDGSVERGYCLTNEGLVDMLEVFGIKTDLDLRVSSPTTKDALGAGVKHKYYDMVMYDNIFTPEGKEKVRAVFEDLANPDNYPIYVHCTYGCDRTGTICYLLEALLGVSRGDCLRDYALSNMNITNIQAVENGLKQYKGDTLKSQAEDYLLSCGVNEYQINSIRKIFLED